MKNRTDVESKMEGEWNGGEMVDEEQDRCGEQDGGRMERRRDGR